MRLRATRLISAGRGRPAWTPAQISTALWLDAADTSTITLNGLTVSQWSDKSGNGRNATQATAAAQPAYNATGLAGKSSLTFNGTSTSMATAYANTTQNLSAFVVGKAIFEPQAAYLGILSGWANGTQNDFDNAQNALILSQHSSPSTSLVSYRVALLGQYQGSLITPFLAASIFNGAQNTIYFNSNSSASVTSTGNFNLQNVMFGARRESGLIKSFWNGELSEVILLNSAIATDDRQKLEGYLAWKWGLAANLPVDHPYKTTPPTA